MRGKYMFSIEDVRLRIVDQFDEFIFRVPKDPGNGWADIGDLSIFGTGIDKIGILQAFQQDGFTGPDRLIMFFCHAEVLLCYRLIDLFPTFPRIILFILTYYWQSSKGEKIGFKGKEGKTGFEVSRVKEKKD